LSRSEKALSKLNQRLYLQRFERKKGYRFFETSFIAFYVSVVFQFCVSVTCPYVSWRQKMGMALGYPTMSERRLSDPTENEIFAEMTKLNKTRVAFSEEVVSS